ncbi:hypothetical protein EYF80_026718 [Liparis tanakae]|uniref:Uncharacterized protein n=1 Tax=Liparis tanakae TaxID=230148 RepID=A0A4Z2HE98_9TELE|nr:hypothetical protein EYF80_026718 [Liparis tanakae]
MEREAHRRAEGLGQSGRMEAVTLLESHWSRQQEEVLLHHALSGSLCHLPVLPLVMVVQEAGGSLRQVDLARHAQLLHQVRQIHVVRPHVELEALYSQDAAQDGARVDAHAHVDGLARLLAELLDGLDHAQAHLHAAVGVVRPRLRAAGHAVVAIPQSADLLAAGELTEVVEAPKEIVEKADQGRRRLVGRHPGETHDIGEEDADGLHAFHVERPEDDLSAGDGGLLALVIVVRETLRGALGLRRSAAAASAAHRDGGGGAGAGGVALAGVVAALTFVVALFHQLVRDSPRHDGVDHALLQGLLHLQVFAVHDGLAHLEEGAAGTHLRHDEQVDADDVGAQMEQGFGRDEPAQRVSFPAGTRPRRPRPPSGGVVALLKQRQPVQRLE